MIGLDTRMPLDVCASPIPANENITNGAVEIAARASKDQRMG